MIVLFIGTVWAYTLGYTDLGLDPAPITGWKHTWTPNVIELDSANAGETTTMRFLFNPTTSVRQGFFEVTFPQGFNITSATCSTTKSCKPTLVVNTLIVPGLTVKGGEDATLILENVALPDTPGGYGPFSVKTRHFMGSSTVDSNLNFGSIGVTKTKGKLKDLSVSLVNSKNAVGATNSTVSLKFTLSQGLSKGDIIRIKPNPYWNINRNSEMYFYPASSSQKFKGSEGTKSNYFSYIASDGYLYLYGLKRDVDADQSADLRISNVTNPNADYSSSNYAWTVETMRLGTRVILDSGTVYGPNTEAEVIKWAQYGTSSGWDTANILPESSVWMSVAFNVSCALSQGSSVYIEFDSADSDYSLDYNNLTDCHLEQYLPYVSKGVAKYAYCFKPDDADFNGVIIADLPEVLPNTTLKVSTQVAFASNAMRQSVQITTKDPQGNIVQSSSGLSAVTLANPSSAQKPDNFSVQFGPDRMPKNSENLRTTAGIQDSNTAIVAWLDPADQEFDLKSQITVGMPFVLSDSLQDFSIALANSGITYYLDAYNLTTLAVNTVLSNSSISIQPATSTKQLGTFTFKPQTKPEENTTLFFVVQGSSSNEIKMPRLASNRANHHEAFLATLDTTGSKRRQLDVVEIFIYPQLLDCTFELLCTVELGVFPIKASFFQNHFDMIERLWMSYFFEIKFEIEGVKTDLGSGLENGDVYPWVSQGEPLRSFILKKETEPILLGDLAYVKDPSKMPVIITTVGDIPWEFGCILNRVSNKYDERTEYYSARKSICLDANSEEEVKKATVTAPVSFGVTSVKERSDLTLDLQDVPAGREVWAVVLASRFTFADTSKVYKDKTIIEDSMVISATNFKFSTIISLSSAAINSITGPLSVRGVIPTDYVKPSDDLQFRIMAASKWGAGADSCEVWTTLKNLTMTPSNFDILTITPKSVPLRGPNSLSHEVSVLITPGSLLPNSTVIVVKLNDKWDYEGSECIVNGLTALSGELSVAYGNNTCNITNFVEIYGSSQINLRFPSVSPPLYDLSAPFIDSIEAFITVQSVRYKISTSSSVVIKLTTASPRKEATFTDISSFPSPSMSDAADVHLKICFTNAIPPGGNIQITSQPHLVSQLDRVWAGEVKIAGVDFLKGLVLGSWLPRESCIDVLIEKCLVDHSQPTMFTVSSWWRGIGIDASTSFYLSPNKALALGIQAGNLTVVPLNLGEEAEYTFSFIDQVEFIPGDSLVIVFPDEYGEQVGASEGMFASEPNAYYLPCRSDLLPYFTYCYVDHRKVIVSVSQQIDKGQTIAVRIRRVINPDVLSTGSFKLWHLNPANETLSGNPSFGKVSLTSAPSILSLQSVEVTPLPNLMSGSAFNFTWEIESDINKTDVVRVDFPPQYDVVFDSEVVSCYLNLKATGQASWSDRSSLLFNRSCTIYGNGFELSSLTSDIKLSDYSMMSIRLIKAFNPRWIFPFSNTTWFKDLTVSEPSLTVDGQTSGFTVKVLDTLASSLKSRSYTSTSKAFMEVGVIKPKVSVNDFNVITKENRLIVSTCRSIAGAQFILGSTATDRTRCNPVLKSEASTGLDFIKITSNTDFTIEAGQTSFFFNVEVDPLLPKGLYYIEWTCFQGNVRKAELDPYKTLLEVKLAELDERLKVDIELEESGGIGTVQVFTLSVEVPPKEYLEVYVNSTSTAAAISATKLRLTNTEAVANFSASVDVDDDPSGKIQLYFSLEGRDKRCYTIESQLSMDNSEAFEELKSVSGSVVSWNVCPPLQNQVTISPLVNGTGIVYYQFTTAGRRLFTCQELIQKIGAPAKRSMRESFLIENEANVTAMKPENRLLPGEDWNQMNERQRKEHLKMDWLGVDVKYTVDYNYSRTFNIMPGVEYVMTGCLGDGITKDPLSTTERFSSPAVPPPETVQLTFKEPLDDKMKRTVMRVIADLLGIAIERLVMKSPAGGRLLQESTVISFDILPDLSSQGPPPSDLANISHSQLKAQLQQAGVEAELEAIDSKSKETPKPLTWVEPVVLKGVIGRNIYVRLQTSAPSKVCCTASSNSTDLGRRPTASQTMMGLNATDHPIRSNCTVSSMLNATLVILSDLEPGTFYFIACAGADFTPVSPAYAEFHYIVAETANDTQVEEAGASLTCLLALLLITLIV
mmetsp:Transcript_18607/g.33619  ORF Transcript_18607/g.33619 Transcript_18607/m.33619 type:complete len:2134 (-) Transcript_18607:11-6412(-)